MPALFYSPATGGDVLYVAYPSSSPVTASVQKGDVVAIYAGNEIVGINVFHASSHFALEGKGLIPLPSQALQDSLNALLAEASLPALTFPSSGYRVYEVEKVEEHPLD